MAHERGAIEFNAPTGRGFGLAAFGRSPLWKNVLAGWQPPRLRFGRETDKLKTEDEP
jgi:hypothetical protein